MAEGSGSTGASSRRAAARTNALYCHDIFGKEVRWRSAEHVLQEIFLLVDKYGVEEFQVVDDIFNLHKPRLKKIFEGLEQRCGVGRLRFCFPNGLRGDILTEDVLETLQRGGTYEITVAIETVTPRLQTLVQKNLDIPKVGRFIDYCYEKRHPRPRVLHARGSRRRRAASCSRRSGTRSARTSFAAFFSVIPQPETPLYDIAKKVDADALSQVNQDDYYQAALVRGSRPASRSTTSRRVRGARVLLPVAAAHAAHPAEHPDVELRPHRSPVRELSSAATSRSTSAAIGSAGTGRSSEQLLQRRDPFVPTTRSERPRPIPARPARVAAAGVAAAGRLSANG